MVRELLQKIRTGCRLSACRTESTTISTPQPQTKAHTSRAVPPGPAGHTAQQPQQRPESMYSNSSRQHDRKLVSGRIPAVTSTARTTAPETEKDRKLRERYPSNFRRGPY